MIQDNGVGFPEGFDIKKKESLGMTLIKNFIQQLEAEGEMGSNDGAYIRFSFKKERGPRLIKFRLIRFNELI